MEWLQNGPFIFFFYEMKRRFFGKWDKKAGGLLLHRLIILVTVQYEAYSNIQNVTPDTTLSLFTFLYHS